MPYEVLLYYRYATVPDPEEWAEQHRAFCAEHGLLGRIIVATEGINGTVSGPPEATRLYRQQLAADPLFPGIEFKVEESEEHVFPKLSIKVRSEIVTLGLDEDLDPNETTGIHLEPAEFREMMEEEEVVLLDGRNDYESDLGRFEGAVCPDIGNFRDFPDWLEKNREVLQGKKILTYCTGGIRCEKLSGLLVREGYDEVFQLDGGIIRYGQDEAVRGEGFEGECYVFDQRVGTGVNRTEGAKVVSLCSGCDKPSPRYRNCAWAPCNRQFFLCENCETSGDRYCCEDCRESGTEKKERC